MAFSRQRIEALAGELKHGRRPNAPAKLAHFVIKTPRHARMIRWYRAVLDAVVVFQDDRVAFLTYDDEHHRVALIKVPAPIALVGIAGRYLRKLYGVDHLAFTYASLPELAATYSRLAGLGIRPVWCINHGPTTSIYYEDPDGNRLELQHDNFATSEELLDFMASGEFDTNPIGVEFDPDVLVARLAAGTPVHELIRRGSASRPGHPPRAGYRTIRWKTL